MFTHKILNLKAWLQGEWLFERIVQDFKSSQIGKMTGQGSFTPHQKGFLYQELARFSFGAYHEEVRQSYLYSFSSLTCAEVFFIDGRFFHTLDLSTGQQQVVHHCGSDIYEGSFNLLSHANWQIKWSIAGPRKKMIINTQFYKY